MRNRTTNNVHSAIVVECNTENVSSDLLSTLDNLDKEITPNSFPSCDSPTNHAHFLVVALNWEKKRSINAVLPINLFVQLFSLGNTLTNLVVSLSSIEIFTTFPNKTSYIFSNKH